MQTAARKIRQLRKKNGQSQEFLAERLHVTRQAVSNWETGKNLPDLDTLLRLAELWGVSVEELIYETPPRAYTKGQRRYQVIVASCISVFILWSAAKRWLVPVLRARAAAQYAPRGLFYAESLFSTLFGVAAGVLFPALLSLWADLRLGKTGRRVCLALGAAALLVTVGLTVFPPYIRWIWVKLLLSVLTGTFLFFGFNP